MQCRDLLLINIVDDRRRVPNHGKATIPIRDTVTAEHIYHHETDFCIFLLANQRGFQCTRECVI